MRKVAVVLSDSSVVVVANDVNLSIFKPPWLVNTGIFREVELQGQVVISPVAVQISSPCFEFSVFPNRLQLTLANPNEQSAQYVDRVLGGIVRLLPHTPYAGVGLNFAYFVAPAPGVSFGDWNRRVFSTQVTQVIADADVQDPKFGGYCSLGALDGRLRIDMRPVRGEGGISKLCESWREGEELMRISFNYHNDVGGSSPEGASVGKILEKWKDALRLSRQIVDRIPG